MAFNQQALADIIKKGNVDFKENSVSYIFDCPLCEKKDKLYIRKRDGQFVCWRCKETDNFKGRPEWALRELYKIPISEIKLQLYGNSNFQSPVDFISLEFEDLFNEDQESISVDPFDLEQSPACDLILPPDFFDVNSDNFIEAARYLDERGITYDQVVKYGIMYNPSEKRLILPIKVDGKIIGWQARYIYNNVKFDENLGMIEIPKILTSDSMANKGGKYLMFQDNLKDSDHCVLGEGPFDALKAELCGGNVASMGKAVTMTQLKTIAKYCKKLYLALDSDAGDEIMRIIQNNNLNLEIYLLETPPNREDLGASTQEEVYEQYKKARPISRSSFVFSLGDQLVF